MLGAGKFLEVAFGCFDVHPGITSGFIWCCYAEILESERWKDSDVESSGGVSSCSPLGDVLMLSLWYSMGRKWQSKSFLSYEVL